MRPQPISAKLRAKLRLPLVSALLLVLTLGLSGADLPGLVRLEIINKAPMAIGVRMTGKEYDQFYYLKVPAASSTKPTVRTFTVTRDRYSTRVYFLETYDLVYGYRCTYSTTTVDARHQTRLLVRSCGSKATLSGEKRRPLRGVPESLTRFESRQEPDIAP
jgi:hypothetical protein